MLVDRMSRAEFLQVLEAVQPGLSKKGIIEQSSSFIFKNGRVITYNEDVAGRAKSGLPKAFTGAIKSTALIELLRKLPDDVIGLDVVGDSFIVKGGHGRRAKLRMDNVITIPLDDLEPPGEWEKLHEDFNEAVTIVQGCAGKDESLFVTTCIHIHPKWMEACDNFHLARYRLPTGASEAFMVKRDALKHIVSLDMTDMSVTRKWVHFKNPSGVVLSCQRYVEEYPCLKENLKVDGQPATLPKGLSRAVDIANIFSQENADSNLIVLAIENNRLTLTAVGTSGEYTEPKKVIYDGPPLAFTIPPDIITEIVSKHPECVISADRLLVHGGKWRYVTSLGDPAAMTDPVTKSKVKKAKAEADESEPDDGGEDA